MRSMKKLYIISFLIAFLTIIPIVNAPDTLDLSAIPQAFSDALGITLFAGQLLASTIFVSLFLFPTMLLMNKRSNQGVAVGAVLIMTLFCCIGFAWLDVFPLVIIILFLSIMLGVKVKGAVT